MGTQHQHAPAAHRFDRAFAIGIALNTAFVAIEAAVGWHIDSLALLADAGHNLSDVAGLLLAWGGAMAGRLRPDMRPDMRHTYGWKRASILAAFVNAMLLLVAMGSLAWEAAHRLQSPQPIQGTTIMAVAGIGIVINTATAMLFMRGREHDINVRGAFLHMAADALVSAGVVVAGALALVLGWDWIDPVVSLVIAAVIVLGSAGLLKQSVHLLFDGVPDGVDLPRVRDFLCAQPGVSDVLDLHVWAMSTTQVALTAHLLVPEGGAGDAFLEAVSHELHARFGIDHVTLQVMGRPVGLTCGSAPSPAQASTTGAQLGEARERPSLSRTSGVQHEHS